MLLLSLMSSLLMKRPSGKAVAVVTRVAHDGPDGKSVAVNAYAIVEVLIKEVSRLYEAISGRFANARGSSSCCLLVWLRAERCRIVEIGKNFVNSKKIIVENQCEIKEDGS
jgi:hypothetical protein